MSLAANSSTSLGADAVGLRPLAPEIGAEIQGVDLWRPITPAIFQKIIDGFHEHCVIVLRGQSLTAANQVMFARMFGPLGSADTFNGGGSRDHSASSLISNVRENGTVIVGLPTGEMLFHSDQCYLENPCVAALLYAIAVPSQGGEMIFGNMYRAYETLPEDLLLAIEGRKALNIFQYDETNGYRESAIERFGVAPPGARCCAHPMVRTHPVTGRKALYVNRGMTLCVEGMDRGESDELLLRLFDHQERPEFQYAHKWRVGDLVMWDNRCTIQARADFSADQRRILRRVAVMGDAPV